MRASARLLLCLLAAGCHRPGPPPPTAPTAPTARPDEPAAVEAPAATPPLDPTPVALAPYVPGSSCNLVLHGDALYWVTQGMAPKQEASGTCTGGVLDCKRTRGTIHRFSIPDQTADALASVVDWPWSLGADDDALYWIAYCSHELRSVPFGGGTVESVGRAGLSFIDFHARGRHVIAADRFGTEPGVYRIDRRSGRTERVAAGGRRPWLLGELGGRIYWAEEQETSFAAHVVGIKDEAIGSFEGMPMDTVVHDGALLVLTTQQIVRIEGTSIQPLSRVPEYHDRGNLAADPGYVYWANGKRGTLARVDHHGGNFQEPRVGTEPCGVALYGGYVYWLDRGNNQLMRASLIVFDDPAPPPPV